MTWPCNPAHLTLALLCGSLCLPPIAHADANFVLRSIDPTGLGFNDPTPTKPVGGNTGTTRGEQRRIAVQYAADLWGDVLDSTVDIVIEATFEELGCDDAGGAILASAAPFAAVDSIRSRWANPNTLYPSALADRLLSTDALPGEPDIRANFNSSIDQANCSAEVNWYYGLDGDGPGVDLVQTTLHELAHGLGMTLLVDAQTGELMLGKPDPFGALIYDHVFHAYLDELTDSERVQALSHARQVVFDGANTTEAARLVLQAAAPTLKTAPTVVDFSGLAADTNFSNFLQDESTVAMAVVGQPADGCLPPTNATGQIVLIRPRCFPDQVAQLVQESGAVGLILGLSEHWMSPPSPLDLTDAAQSTLPIVVVSAADADALSAAIADGPLEITMAPDEERRAGTDADGRVLLNATAPVTASMLSHWDMSTRPNLLMEPFVRPVDDIHSVDLTLAALNDLGWSSPCGNGVVDNNEQCDDGAGNSATSANACRTDCTTARCGDQVIDTGEDCDDGDNNGPSGPCTDAGTRLSCPAGQPDCTATTGGMVTVPSSGGCDDCATGGTETRPADDGGCGCAVVGGTPADSAGTWLCIVALGLVYGRLRRRMRPRSDAAYLRPRQQR